MHLSDEQTRAATHGLPNELPDLWRIADLPEGRQPVPVWAKDLWIEWMDEYSNAPSYVIKSAGNLYSWSDKRYAHEGSRFMAVSDDGRASVYYQDGPLHFDSVRRFRTADGKLHVYPPQENHRAVAGEWVEVQRLCTRQEKGFGGSHIDITLLDGTEATLRGPWHGGAPNGFVEFAYCDMTTDVFKNHNKNAAMWKKRSKHVSYWNSWGTACGGLFLSHETFMMIFARFKPHLRLAWVNEGRGERLQAMKPEWTEPKPIMLARQRLERMDSRR